MRGRRTGLLLLLAALGACAKVPQGKPAPVQKAPAEAPLGIELQRGQDPREMVWIGTRGLVVGPLPGPLARKFFVDPRRSDLAWYLLRTFAPFAKKGAVWDLAFHGQGKVKAGATEQRMIYEWARQTAAEVGGQGGPAYGLALTWHQGGSSLDCQDVAVYLTGEAVASSCAWDGEVRGWLEPGTLGKLYGWFDRLAPFQAGGGQTQESLRPGALETRLIFAGKGVQPATEKEQEEIQSFGAELFGELAGRRNGNGAAAVPAQLLMAPGALNPRQEEVVLQLPEKAPAPPTPAPQRPSAPAPAPPQDQPPG